MPTILNPVEKLLEQAATRGNRPFLHQPLHESWRTYSWAEVADGARRIATALIALGLPKGSRVAIAGINTAHWFMADFACGLAGMVGVGLYPRQTPEHTRFILEDSGTKALILGPLPEAARFLEAVPPDVMRIATPYVEVPKQACQHQWDELVATHEPIAEPVPRGVDELWSLIYTSGTTGNPKGVMVTAANLGFVASGLLRYLPSRGAEAFLSYLPLAHSFERAAIELSSLYLDAEVYFLASLDQLGETLRLVRPTRFFSVPLVWSRMQREILLKLPQEKLDRLLGIPLVATLVRHRIRRALGLDRCWCIISGAAPLSLETMGWFSRIGIEICQGYGMTENGIYCSTNLPGANRPGSVGRPFPDSQVKIDGSDNAEGEILNRHGGVTPGYFNNPGKTAELFTQDGWLKTGDIGHQDTDGYLWITGRAKEIFKTAKGKYVAPAPIESALAAAGGIDYLCLAGAELTQPTMLAVLDAAERRQSHDAVKARLTEAMAKVNANLEPHERIARIILVKDDWSIDNGLLTPTLKVKRAEVEHRYRDLLEKENRNPEPVVWEP